MKSVFRFVSGKWKDIEKSPQASGPTNWPQTPPGAKGAERLFSAGLTRVYERPDFEVRQLEQVKPLSSAWDRERRLRIPSSLVHRAVSMSDSFMDHYPSAGGGDLQGHGAEDIVLEAPQKLIKGTGVRVGREYQW